MIAVNTKFSFNFRQQFCFDIKFEFMLKNSKHKSHFSNFLKKKIDLMIALPNIAFPKRIK